MVGEVGFSPWINRRNRKEIERNDFPGVYFITKSKKVPSDYRVKNGSIIYIGEATGQTLGDRLSQFHNSAFNERLGHSDTLYLAHYPVIQKTWENYLEKQWMPWTEKYNRYFRVQKVYTSLFHIYQEQQKPGEQYELVFSKGLLNWKPPSGHEAKRHVIVAKASLEFEPHLGKFTVKTGSRGGSD